MVKKHVIGSHYNADDYASHFLMREFPCRSDGIYAIRFSHEASEVMWVAKNVLNVSDAPFLLPFTLLLDSALGTSLTQRLGEGFYRASGHLLGAMHGTSARFAVRANVGYLMGRKARERAAQMASVVEAWVRSRENRAYWKDGELSPEGLDALVKELRNRGFHVPEEGKRFLAMVAARAYAGASSKELAKMLAREFGRRSAEALRGVDWGEVVRHGFRDALLRLAREKGVSRLRLEDLSDKDFFKLLRYAGDEITRNVHLGRTGKFLEEHIERMHYGLRKLYERYGECLNDLSKLGEVKEDLLKTLEETEEKYKNVLDELTKLREKLSKVREGTPDYHYLRSLIKEKENKANELLKELEDLRVQHKVFRTYFGAKPVADIRTLLEAHGLLTTKTDDAITTMHKQTSGLGTRAGGAFSQWGMISKGGG